MGIFGKFIYECISELNEHIIKSYVSELIKCVMKINIRKSKNEIKG